VIGNSLPPAKSLQIEKLINMLDGCECKLYKATVFQSSNPKKGEKERKGNSSSTKISDEGVSVASVEAVVLKMDSSPLFTESYVKNPY
jgi:hypothetical protein